MTSEERYFARTQFKLRIYAANGQRYQDIFVNVMTKRYDGFRPIKPQGRNIGDEANDGYIAEAGRYYQVYAPEEPDEKITYAVNKAKNNFKRLKEKWQETAPIEEYFFVFNDKFLGSYPEIEHTLASIEEDNDLKVCASFLAKDLENEFMKLSKDDMIAVLESVIPHAEELQDIDYGILSSILQHVVDNNKSLSISSLPDIDIDKKIEFNCISKYVAILLNVGSFQQGTIRDYFFRNGIFTRADIRDRLAALYKKAKEKVLEYKIIDIAHGDQIFFAILDEIVPSKTRAVQDAAIALMAFFFETCDIFEEPPNE